MFNNALNIGAIINSPESKYQYQIIKMLGQGGFGITYLAQLSSTSDQTTTPILVALKEFFMRDINGRIGQNVTATEGSEIYKKYYSKFQIEAKNLSQLKHEYIIKILELFKANNTLYYSMEYIDGGSLEDYINQRNGLPEQEAINYIKQIASALSFMHSHHMLHLDMKPGNIMRRGNGNLVLIDFGLSKQYDETGHPESSTTIGAGTPGYAPLEQTDYHGGKDFPVTLDIYALGATFFKMLTGTTPPVASNVMNYGIPKGLLQEAGVSNKSIVVIEHAMSPRKQDRFLTVKEMVDAIEGRIEIKDSQTCTELTQAIQNNPNFRVYKWANGQQYEGEWKDNIMHGKGRMTYSDGRIYEGLFVNGKRQGKGTLIYPNGEMYIGEFVDDRMSEDGILYNSDGSIMQKKEEKRPHFLVRHSLLIISLLLLVLAVASAFWIFDIFSTGSPRVVRVKFIIAPIILALSAFRLLINYLKGKNNN